MILNDTLREIARSQHSEQLSGETGIRRSALAQIDLSLPHAHIISGIRRCGESTLLRQLALTFLSDLVTSSNKRSASP